MLVSLAAAIALGATSMSDIALLAHLAPVLGDAPSGPTVRRALDLAGTAASLDRIARARAKARAHVWQLIEDTIDFEWIRLFCPGVRPEHPPEPFRGTEREDVSRYLSAVGSSPLSVLSTSARYTRSRPVSLAP